MDCIFCNIVGGKIPAQKLFEDEQALAFRDIHAQAPVHVLIVSKEHFSSLAAMGVGDPAKLLLGHLLTVANQIARAEQLASGYRLVINTGWDGGQTVDHLHLHLLGGRAMNWPPG